MEKREIQKLFLSLTQVAGPHRYALRLVSYPEVFVSLVTPDASLEWFVQGMPTSSAGTKSLLQL